MRRLFGVGLLAIMVGAIPAAAQPMPGADVSHTTVRVYLLRGIGDELTSSAVDGLGDRVQAAMPRSVVQVFNWHEDDDVLADATAHPSDRLVVIGFSKGSESASEIADRLARRGIPSKLIALDPLCARPSVPPTPLVDAINVYEGECGDGDGRMPGARNIRVRRNAPTGVFALAAHAGFPALPVVQRIVRDEIVRYAMVTPDYAIHGPAFRRAPAARAD